MKTDISKEKAEAVFQEYSAYVYRVALFLTKSKALADDITQETFIQIFRKYYRFDVSKPIKPWIYKITLNTTRNILRKQRWLHFVGETPEIMDGESIENTYIRSEEAVKLWEEINKLTLKSREVIILHFYCGMKLKEIADIIDVPLGTCKSRLNQGLKALRTNLPENDIGILNKGGDIIEQIITLLTVFTVGFASYGIIRTVDNIDYPFVEDQNVIGKWQSVDFVERVEKFDPSKRAYTDDFYLSELAFIEGGDMFIALEGGNLAPSSPTWTKGLILDKQDKTASKYEIKDIDGQTFMFLEWKSGDYIFRGLNPQYYVLKKVDSNDYSGLEIPHKEDKIDYPFINDPQILGSWRSVDYVENIDDFTPGVKSILEDLYLTDITISEDGKVDAASTTGNHWDGAWTWTKGLILDNRNKLASKCEIKEIDGETYMFFGWKNGDYVLREMEPHYYVLKKVE